MDAGITMKTFLRLGPQIDVTVERLRGPQRLMGGIGLLLMRSTQRTFDAQGRPTKWRGLSPATIAKRRRGRSPFRERTPGGVAAQRRAGGRMGGFKILQDTGILMESITMRLRGANRVVVGTNLPYARIHQWGGTIVGTFNVRRHWRYQEHFPGRKGEEAVKVAPRAVMVRAHSRKVSRIDIHARPFLRVQAEDERHATRMAKDFLATGEAQP